MILCGVKDVPAVYLQFKGAVRTDEAAVFYNIIPRCSEIRVEQFYNEICAVPRRYNYCNTIILTTTSFAYCRKVVVRQAL